jgi:hypothetical protein
VVVIVKTKVVKEVQQQLSRIGFTPLGNAGQKHYDQSVSADASTLRLIEPVIAGQLFKHVEHRPQERVILLLLDDKTGNGASVVSPVQQSQVYIPRF